ncbi:DUF1499 domain-containing protein [Longimicrobium sp.]|uniref:DUF1499 domain-containing protein n=1 Tax=Longimicrobium sp. TaxID=2029185 RepID=UPI002BEE8303|nr:DUF1499 domain-containing protein [Longimicrobium sp.]HSU13130.1 DUF1499 domain-containing protein [Longimicrobium sp.]
MTDDLAARPAPGTLGRTLAILALVLGAAGFLMVVLAGPGSRLGWWDFVTGLRTMFKYGAYLGIFAVVVAIAAMLVVRRGPGRGALVMAAIALLLGLAAWYFPWSFRRHAMGVPPIHDITTDFTNPPDLTYSRMLRDTSGGKLNNWMYEGDSVAAQQRKAYPDIQPVMLAMNPDQAYRAAMRTARDMGWEIVVNDPAGRRIEAVDETRWFGFKDDVSIRVKPASGISRVDIRSVSRVGRSDVGKNAERIRAYIARLKQNNRREVADTA